MWYTSKYTANQYKNLEMSLKKKKNGEAKWSWPRLRHVFVCSMNFRAKKQKTSKIQLEYFFVRRKIQIYYVEKKIIFISFDFSKIHKKNAWKEV